MNAYAGNRCDGPQNYSQRCVKLTRNTLLIASSPRLKAFASLLLIPCDDLLVCDLTAGWISHAISDSGCLSLRHRPHLFPPTDQGGLEPALI